MCSGNASDTQSDKPGSILGRDLPAEHLHMTVNPRDETDMAMGWVNPWVGLGWVGFNGLSVNIVGVGYK